MLIMTMMMIIMVMMIIDHGGGWLATAQSCDALRKPGNFFHDDDYYGRNADDEYFGHDGHNHEYGLDHYNFTSSQIDARKLLLLIKG